MDILGSPHIAMMIAPAVEALRGHTGTDKLFGRVIRKGIGQPDLG